MLITAYLNLRLKSIFRQLMELGVIGILFLILLFCQLFNKELYSNNTVLYWAIIILFSLAEIHVKRNDKDFIKLYFSNRFLIFFLEYLFLSAPLLIPILIYSAYQHLAVIILVIIIISIVPNWFNKATPIPTIFPSLSLDWKSGFRRFYLLYGVLFLATLVGGFYDNLIFVEAIIYIVMIIASDFNTSFEHKYYLLQHSGKPYLILVKIIMASLISYLLFNSLYLISLFIFSSYNFFALSKTITIVVSIHLILILLKYTVYRIDNPIIYGLLKILVIAISLMSYYLGHCEYLALIPILGFLSIKRISHIVA